jgi:DNA repair ATPase RecN
LTQTYISKQAKSDGLARLEATRILAKDLEHETSTNGYALISAETKQQENQWVEWETSLAETEIAISAALAELEEYQDGFRTEKNKLEQILTDFQNSCQAIEVPKVNTENIRGTIEKLLAGENSIKQIGGEVNLIRTRLNVLCRKFSNEDASD